MSFEKFAVLPQRPTLLESRQWLPLPASDFSFYPAVNTYTLPEALDPVRLQDSLSRALQVYPAYAGRIAKNPNGQKWQIELVNRPVWLTIGNTTEPGPFSNSWKGERHPDYYDELPRITVGECENQPLVKAKVTTWLETGQTAVMVSQSYCLGDAFSSVSFVHCWSSFYQGKSIPYIPTMEKYFLPDTLVAPAASHASDLECLSWMAADFNIDFHHSRIEQMEKDTERLDLTFSGDFIDFIWTTTKQSAASATVGRSDSFASYLISVIQNILDQPVHHAHQLVTIRDRPMSIGRKTITLPKTTMGNAYMICSFPIEPSTRQLPSSLAASMYDARRWVTDPERLGRLYTLYNSFYEKAICRDRIFVDSGYPDAIAVNWLVGAGMTEAHFGYPEQAGHIEWESLENFVQVWKANPARNAEGLWTYDPNGFQVLLRLRHKYVAKFKARLEADESAMRNSKQGGISSRL